MLLKSTFIHSGPHARTHDTYKSHPELWHGPLIGGPIQFLHSLCGSLQWQPCIMLSNHQLGALCPIKNLHAVHRLRGTDWILKMWCSFIRVGRSYLTFLATMFHFYKMDIVILIQFRQDLRRVYLFVLFCCAISGIFWSYVSEKIFLESKYSLHIVLGYKHGDLFICTDSTSVFARHFRMPDTRHLPLQTW